MRILGSVMDGAARREEISDFPGKPPNLESADCLATPLSDCYDS